MRASVSILVLSILALSSCSQEEHIDVEQLTAIRDRRGLLSFRIPAHWSGGYDEQKGAEFWDDPRGSGTLWLTVAAFEGEAGAYDGKSAADLLRSPDLEGSVQELPNGDAINEFVRFPHEGDEDLVIHHWLVCHLLPPTQHRIAFFSYAVLEDDVDDPETVHWIETLGQEIRRAEFDSGLGRLGR